MVTNHSRTGTGYGILTDSYRTGKFCAIFNCSTKEATFNTTLTKINIGFLTTSAIPSLGIFTNSNVTGLFVIKEQTLTLTDSYIFVIRCRISSHRRSHACTGHNTCCNQHCQQLFGRAAFSSMAFCHFGNNDICVARFTPNYFEYFVHKKHLTHKYYYLYTVRNTCHVWKQVKQLFQ